MSSKSKARLPSEPLISIRIAFLRPGREAGRLEDAHRAAAEPGEEGGRVVHGHPCPRRRRWWRRRRGRRSPSPGSGRSWTKVSSIPLTVVMLLTGDVLGQVDDVRADVAERAGAGLVLVQPPAHRGGGVGDPVLEVLRADVPHGADPALLDQPAGQRDGRDAAVGEADHRHGRRAAAARSAAVGHRLGLGDGVGERLLAEHVLARVERGDRDLGVGVARRADVDQVDVVAGRAAGASRSPSTPSPGGRRPRRPCRRRGRRPPASAGAAAGRRSAARCARRGSGRRP